MIIHLALIYVSNTFTRFIIKKTVSIDSNSPAKASGLPRWDLSFQNPLSMALFIM